MSIADFSTEELQKEIAIRLKETEPVYRKVSLYSPTAFTINGYIRLPPNEPYPSRVILNNRVYKYNGKLGYYGAEYEITDVPVVEVR